MPELNQYLHGFGIEKGLQLGNYILENVRGYHNTIEKYRRYEYHIEMVFIPQMSGINPNDLMSNLRQMTSGKRIINSAYGNPYECDFGNPDITQIYPDGKVLISTVGHSHRV